jgi:uncharacterized protein (DUF1501 family)
MNIQASRRKFLQAAFGGTAIVSLSRFVPSVLMGASRATAGGSGTDGRILIVIELGGGNDGLNTVVPFSDDEYYRNRFTLAVGRDSVLKVNDRIGLHPSLAGFANLLEKQQLGIVQGVGYPEPNRSHFESMDLWHTAHRSNDSPRLGWLGRCIDDAPVLSGELAAIHYGEGKQPLALSTRTRPVASISSLEQFRLNAGDTRRFADNIRDDLKVRRAGDNALLGFVHESTGVALRTAEKIEKVLGNEGRGTRFPDHALGRRLAAISQLIASGLPTSIYYVTHNGFDTHANQRDAHASLLSQLGGAVEALMNDLAEQGNAGRTCVLMFSEFGRRVRENASRGTDHGTAGPVFLAGGNLLAGAVNGHPSLTDLDQGDLKFSVDYRSVYATVLEKWLGIPGGPVLGGDFKTLDLFASK